MHTPTTPDKDKTTAYIIEITTAFFHLENYGKPDDDKGGGKKDDPPPPPPAAAPMMMVHHHEPEPNITFTETKRHDPFASLYSMLSSRPGGNDDRRPPAASSPSMMMKM